MLFGGVTHAQSLPADAVAASQASPSIAASGAATHEQRVEHIHVEDAGSVIDEVRIGGQTKSIKVQPKGGMPAYQVAPVSGERSWKVLGF